MLNQDEKELVGHWKGAGGYSRINQAFEFRDDGTYSYEADQGSAWQLSHEGTFRLRESQRNPSDRILVLKPTRIIAEPSRAGQLKLEEYTFMDNSEREFKIRDSYTPGPPTKSLVDLNRDSMGVMFWRIIKNDPKYRP